MIQTTPAKSGASNNPTRLTVTGRLEELSGHNGYTGRLWEAGGKSWLCHFQKALAEELVKVWMHSVRVAGRAIDQPGVGPTLEVETLVDLDDGATSHLGGELPFWKSLSLDELARMQGVGPVSNLDELSSLWPVDDDPDELMRFIEGERSERRAVMREGSRT